MSATDIIRAGEPLPRIRSVSPEENWTVSVTWENGDRQRVDLAPTLFTYKFYRPLREDRALFRTVHPIEDGAAIAWGDDDAVDMAATTVARLAAETMEPADFSAFLKRHALTFDAAAAQLGISRRLVAYYASERQLPRHIALACAYLDGALGTESEAQI
jgi:hypothetical protein